MNDSKTIFDLANELVSYDRLRLRKIILEQMMTLQTRHLDPSWANFTRSEAWENIAKMLGKEQQFIYRCQWMTLYKEMYGNTK